MREVVMTGKTVEQATELACQALGLSREEVSVEIIDMPVKKLFKFIPAKVKVIADTQDIASVSVAPPKPAPAQTPKPDTFAPEEKAVPQTKPVSESKPMSAPRPAQAARPKSTEHRPYEDMQSVPVDLQENAKAKLACDYMQDICTKMGVKDAKISAETRGEVLIIKIDGDNVSMLIGRRGETMESLSYLCGLVINKNDSDYTRIGIDVSGYRLKREDGLSDLAKRIAEKVIKSGRGQALEPMNPYERRIIHAAVGEVSGAKSESVGEGTNRRVVIMAADSIQNPMDIAKSERPFKSAPSRSGKPPQRFNNDRAPSDKNAGHGSGGQNKSGSSSYKGNSGKPPMKDRSNVPNRDFANRPRTDAAPVAPVRTETVNDNKSIPLYGKIEL